MSNTQLMQVGRQSDKTVLACFKKIAQEFQQPAVRISIIGYPALGQVDLINEHTEDLKAIVKANSALIDTVSVNIEGMSVAYHRGGILAWNGQQKLKSPYYDEVEFSQNNQATIDPANRIKLTVLIAKHLKAHTAEAGIGKTKEQSDLEAIHTATLERLEALNEELLNTTHDYRKSLDSEYNDKKLDLENEINEKQVELSEEYKTKKDKLDKEKEQLEVRRKEVDDKDNTHARREIRRDILKEIKNRQDKFSLTQGTVKLRKPIGYAMVALISLFLLGAVTAGIEVYKLIGGDNSTPLIIASIKQGLYSLGLFGSVLFFIRWLNRWFEQHSQTEFALKHFELDMERASWLVESSLEWSDAKGASIPPELLSSLSSNLFQGGKEAEPLVHPSDQLASALLGSASSIKLKSGDSSIEIDPKKLAKGVPSDKSSNK
jgi:hypothetical protein